MNNIYSVFLPKYLSGIISGIKTSNKRNRLACKYMNENIMATEYVNIVATMRLLELFSIKACIDLSTKSGFLLT